MTDSYFTPITELTDAVTGERYTIRQVLDSEHDTHEQVILRGFSKNRFPIYESRQPDGTYKLVCYDPEWTGA